MAIVATIPKRFRKLPALNAKPPQDPDLYPAGKEGRCARLTGHVLVVRGDRIECERCSATWTNEGF